MTSLSDDTIPSVHLNEITHNQHQDAIQHRDTPDPIQDGSGQKLGADGLTYPIGFLHVTFDANSGNAVGGMLVTDNTGIPLEFLITSAVRPTRAQQILYGKRLRSYISINLCGAQLLKDIKTKPKAVFVRDEFMLGLIEQTSIPVLMLQQVEQLGSVAAQPVVVPPKSHPEYADIIALSSLNADMFDAFDRIEKCREVLAARSDDYKI